MGRGQKQKARDKNKGSLPQVPKNMKTGPQDVEFNEEIEAQADLEELALSREPHKKP